MSATAPQAQPELARWEMPALFIGLVALLFCIVGWLLSPEQFFRSYLVAYIFWVGLALGCLAILMIQYLTGGAWGIIIRRVLESASNTFPLLALMFVPVLLGLRNLYVWTHAAAIAADVHLQHKHAYLNTTFFIVRWSICAVVWSSTAYLLNRWSRAQDRTAEPKFALRLQNLSGPGLFILAITLTFALIDWVMSLEADWYSTIYGVTFMAGEVLAAFAFVIVVVVLLSKYQPLSSLLLPKHFRDLGNLLLTFVMLWAYCAFSQFLLIWSGNLREEIPWYLRRMQGGWGWLAAALILFHFFLPFFLLLSGDVKQRARRLLVVALIVLAMRFVDLLWLIAPVFSRAALSAHWGQDIAHLALTTAALFGLGGVWLWLFIRGLRSSSLLPLNDPYFEEAFSNSDE
jgi:hypothetical protein